MSQEDEDFVTSEIFESQVADLPANETSGQRQEGNTVWNFILVDEGPDEVIPAPLDLTTGEPEEAPLLSGGGSFNDFTVDSPLELLMAQGTLQNSDLRSQEGGKFGTDQSSAATPGATLPLVNSPPTASDDTGATDEDTVLNVAAAGVLANDSDPDTSDSLSVTAFDAVSALGAAVVVNADGSYSYDPTGSATLNALAVGESASDSFTYTVSDGNGGSDTVLGGGIGSHLGLQLEAWVGTSPSCRRF